VPSIEPGRILAPKGIVNGFGKDGVLARDSYLAAHETGTLDSEANAALQKFQADQHLARTGAPDQDTLRELGLSPKDILLPPRSKCSAAGAKANQSNGLDQQRECGN
jgi:hypothetical protein